MRVELREHVNVGGTTRTVEVVRVDWAARAVFLPDGRWIPFENVRIGEAASKGATLAKGAVPYPCAELKCDRCGRDDFTKASSLGGHKRHCKGTL